MKSTSYCRRCDAYHSGAWRSFCPDCGMLLIPSDSPRNAYTPSASSADWSVPGHSSHTARLEVVEQMRENVAMAQPSLYAHYFASRARKYVVLSTGPEPRGREITVAGKSEARRVAAQHSAKPYNF